MEKNIHDDRLDDYVRKSFEDYEETPAFDMWARIEDELAPADDPVPLFIRLWPSFSRIVAAAAILLLLCALVCNRLYYENKIREMAAQQVRKQQSASETVAPPHSPTPSGASAGHTNPESSTGARKMLSPHLKTPHIDNAATNDAKSTNSGSVSVQRAGDSVQPLSPKSPVVPAFVENAPPVQAPEHPFPAAAGKDTSDASGPESLPTDLSERLKFNYLQPLVTAPLSKPAAFTPPVIPVVPSLATGSEWYLGIQATPAMLVEKTGPERTGGMRPRLVSAQEKTGFTADYWLKLGRKGPGIWGFESGIGYRKIERNALHTARFRLLNGRLNTGGGPQERSYDFDYDLDTYGGSAEVTLRMEQVDPGTVIPETEPVRIQVRTSEQTTLLRLPLLATATFGKGRTYAVIKGGILSNIVLHNELDIVTRVSENVQFRPGQGSSAYMLRPNRAGKIYLGYQFSAGMEYRAGRHWSWVLEPSVSGDFARKNSAGRYLPAIVTTGVNAGINYYF